MNTIDKSELLKSIFLSLDDSDTPTELVENLQHKYIKNLIAEPEDDRSVMMKLADLKKANENLFFEVLDSIVKLKGEDWIDNLQYDWSMNARQKQKLPLGNWSTWVLCCGRAFGKTRTGSETIKEVVETGQAKRIALIGATANDVNKTMVSGEAGILSVYPDHQKPVWNQTHRTITWYNPDGSIKALAELFSADAPERLRGPSFDFGWLDELASWRYQYAYDMYRFCLRIGNNPRTIITTTPKPIPILLDVLKLDSTWVTQGTSYENKANLADTYYTDTLAGYEGAQNYLGRQEIYAEIIDEVPNAMWTQKNIDEYRIDLNSKGVLVNSHNQIVELPDFLHVVIAIDPATTTRKTSAETAMCVAAYGEDGHFYVMEITGARDEPTEWAKKAEYLFEQYRCDKLIAEVNNGGDLVETVIKSVNPNRKVHAVHASRGKSVRAEPIASLYAQGKVHHVGRFPQAEEQMITFNPQMNPYGLKDRVDALVWAMTFLQEYSKGFYTSNPAVGGERKNLSSYQSYMKEFTKY